MLAAFAGFTLAAAMAALYLWEERRLKRRDARLLRLRVPPLEALDRSPARAAAVALLLLSAGIVARAGEPRRDGSRRGDGRLGARSGVSTPVRRAAARARAPRPARRVARARWLRARRRRPSAHPFRLVRARRSSAVSHHRAPVELRERVAVDLDGAPRRSARRLAVGCEAVVLSTCNRTELYLAADGDEAISSRAPPLRSSTWPAARPTLSPRSSTGLATSRRRCTSSGSPPASTRSCRARARSSARSGRRTRSGDRPAARPAVSDRPARRTPGARRRPRSARAPPPFPRPPLRWHSRCSSELQGRRVVLRRCGQDERADRAQPRRSRGAVIACGREPAASERRGGSEAAAALVRSRFDRLAGELRGRRRRRRLDERAGLRAPRG